MSYHSIKRYHDGYQWCEFCELCAKEGLRLIEEPDCPEKIVSKTIDKKSEPK